MSNVITCYQVCDNINFEINLGFLIRPFSYMIKKVITKIKISEERKEIFIIFKGFLLKQIKITFLEDENPTLNYNKFVL